MLAEKPMRAAGCQANSGAFALYKHVVAFRLSARRSVCFVRASVKALFSTRQ